MTKKYKIIFDKKKCIGALACYAVAQKYWKLTDDGKVDLIGATQRKDDKYELIVKEGEIEANRDAADSCPVYAIEIEEINDGQFILDGQLSINDFNDVFKNGRNIESETTVSTIAGFVMEDMGRIPDLYDECGVGGYRFKIIEKEGNKIEKIHVELLSEGEKNDQQESNFK